MYMTKKAGRLIIIYSLAAVLTMAVMLSRANSDRDDLRRAVAVGYDNAFVELGDCVEGLDASLKKTLCAATPSMVSDLCAQGYAHASAASQAIASLPYGNIELEHTAAFLAKTGDYMLSLSRSAARGSELSEEERKNLLTLSESAAQVSEALGELTARMLTGEVSVEELERAEGQIAGAEEDLAGFSRSFRDMEEELPEMPSLIYDGPFSGHIEGASPRALEGLSEVDEEGARKAATDFLGLKSPSFTTATYREGRIPVYVLTRQNGGEIETLEVTKTGGKVIYFGTVREPREGTVTPEDAVKTAARFLDRHGFGDMEPTYHTAEGGEIVINFAGKQDGVICYPDLVKVTVASDTGAVVGMEAEGYLTCHTVRTLGNVAFDTENVALSPYLAVSSHRPALIPTAGKNEVLCEEYLCKTPEGRHVLVYLNAETGREEQILLLLESDSGTLTI